LKLSPAADALLQETERFLEPQLAPGEQSSRLAGWANKLAGAVARIAAVFHRATGVTTGMAWQSIIPEKAVADAAKLRENYLTAHAMAAFGMMGADPRVEQAPHVLTWLKRRLSEDSEYSEAPSGTFTRRDVHQALRRTFKRPEDLDQALELLCRHLYLAKQTAFGQVGRGHKEPCLRAQPGVHARLRALDPVLTVLTVLT
jgi:hypothetical protein